MEWVAKKIAEQIISGEGEYIFNLKRKKGRLHNDILLFFEKALSQQKSKIVFLIHLKC